MQVSIFENWSMIFRGTNFREFGKNHENEYPRKLIPRQFNTTDTRRYEKGMERVLNEPFSSKRLCQVIMRTFFKVLIIHERYKMVRNVSFSQKSVENCGKGTNKGEPIRTFWYPGTCAF